jgi:hypothetical protein
MSKHLPTQQAPHTVSSNAFARNEIVVSPTGFKAMADNLNRITTWQKKFIFATSQDLNSVDAGAAGTVGLWRVFFRSSQNTAGIRVFLGITDTDYGAAANPNVVVTLKAFIGGATVSTFTTRSNGRQAGANPAEIVNTTYHSFADLTGIDANTEYYITVQAVDGARPIYCAMTELGATHADDANASVVDAGRFVAEGPIYYQDIQDVSNAIKSQWRHNAVHLLSWAMDDDNPVYCNSTSYVNLLDGATSVASTSAGFKLQTNYHNTTSRTTVPVRFAVNAVRLSGSNTLDVRLYDGTNSIELTGIGTGGQGDWYVTTTTMPVGFTKYDLQAKVGATTEFDIYAISLFEWES